MAVRTLESEPRLYLRYEFKVLQLPSKSDVLQIKCIDNYRDSNYYMFVNSGTGEVYSYDDAALKRCMKMLDDCRIDVYNVVSGMYLKAYFTEPFGRLVKVDGAELKESDKKNELRTPTAQQGGSAKTEGVNNKSISKALLREANKLKSIQEDVDDGLITDVLEDLKNIASNVEKGDVEAAQRLIHSTLYDMDTFEIYANNLTKICSAIRSIADKLNTN